MVQKKVRVTDVMHMDNLHCNAEAWWHQVTHAYAFAIWHINVPPT
jgi:hypothetical protein